MYLWNDHSNMESNNRLTTNVKKIVMRTAIMCVILSDGKIWLRNVFLCNSNTREFEQSLLST